eukprot:CAMPEP_0119405658 /NCGR_PEP_ID=MMETSP1335-20130426/265_1 /TAXON_ID=259385 /ORGANISM="Chrysoculter rhomboideus, Strain RCC1486" /LENGTH=311 /DNA_ID=CAMNT_0007429681 /DNA_START=51 /DNA_END=983 /DNA_ORIENTATION=+
MALCKPKARNGDALVEGSKEERLPTKPPRKDRATLEREYASERGKFQWRAVNFIFAIILFVPVIFFSTRQYRVGAPINNSVIQYAGMPFGVELAVRLVLTFAITSIVITWIARLGTRMLTIRTLWVMYFCIGAIFHMASWEKQPLPDGSYGPPSWRSPGFTALTAMHVMTEVMLSLSTVIPRSQSEWWNTRVVVYGYLGTFLALACQQKTFSLYVIIGGVFALPADTFTLFAGIAIWQRASDASVKMFAAIWALNTPLIGSVLALLNWRSASADNWTGLGVIALMVQYILLASFAGKHVVLRDLPDDELEK